MSYTISQTFDLEALNSRSPTECQSTPRTLKVPISPSLLILEVLNVKPTYRQSWARNLLVWSDLTLDPSFKVKPRWRNIRVLITLLLLVLEVCNVKPNCRISRVWNLVMLSDLTFSASFKVK